MAHTSAKMFRDAQEAVFAHCFDSADESAKRPLLACRMLSEEVLE